MNASITIETLAAAWVIAKAGEDRAKAERYEIEKAMLALMPSKEEGTVSHGEGSLKVSATYKLTRKVDATELQGAWTALPEIVQAAFTWKPDVSISQLRALEKANPENYQIALRFITSAPAKPSIKVEQK